MNTSFLPLIFFRLSHFLIRPPSPHQVFVNIYQPKQRLTPYDHFSPKDVEVGVEEAEDKGEAGVEEVEAVAEEPEMI